ncbi:M20 family metallo-hydrolase [Jeotgalibacillus soli]|uniref:Allantoate amidohydrolase n=1 Tax=Jeotgalibacillus soli TaxID=889306 RepID=A0A0C2VLN3_9BACL|nr:M20 family metallo-hydrolase [Jeotgalibacillus soli]KIL49837.1 allantoate amidohydrolase [Jeotgalibacillus soli]
MNNWLETTLLALNLTNKMQKAEGFTRLGLSLDEQRSMAVFCKTASDLGLSVKKDPAGNIIARWNPAQSILPAVVVGSHLDTVTNGGGYDGAAGVLCGLAAVKKLQDEQVIPSHPIEVVCFISEESARFGISTIGSKAMAGMLDKGIGSVKDAHGVTIKEAAEQVGIDWGNVMAAERDESEIKSFVELHIEQGLEIERHHAEFGVVQGIACPIRLKITVNGKAGHTGTTPMGERNDALVAIAPLVTFVSEEAASLSAGSELPIVATVSTVELSPNSMNVIPGKVELGIDIRSVEDALKEKMAEKIVQQCKRLQEQLDGTITIETLVHNPSVHLDASIMNRIKEAGEKTGFKSHVMNSGAGHDVMNMAKKWPSGLLFIRCRDGLSHHPEEHADIEDLAMGVSILSAFLRQEAGEVSDHTNRDHRTHRLNRTN